MKTLSMSLCFIAFGVGVAAAADAPPASEFRAAAGDAASSPARPALAHAPNCRVERLSLIWGPDRQPGAYECYGPVKSP